jgi:hypothetical protein
MKRAATTVLALLVPAGVAFATDDVMPPVVWECALGVIVVETNAQRESGTTRAGCKVASPAAERAALRAVEAWQPAADRMPTREPDVPCPDPTHVQPNYAFKPTAGDAPSPCRSPRQAAA